VNYCDSVPVHFAISESLNWYRVTTQLRCGDMFNNHFITNFPQNAAVKKKLEIGQYLAKIWTQVCGFLFEPPCIYFAELSIDVSRDVFVMQRPSHYLNRLLKSVWKKMPCGYTECAESSGPETTAEVYHQIN